MNFESNDHDVIEWQFNSDQTVEGSYKLDSWGGTKLYHWALSNFSPADLENIESKEIDMISSFTPKNGPSDAHDAAVFVMNGVPPGPGQWSDYYAIKVFKNRPKVLKYYDLDFARNPQFPLPPESRIAYEFGMGCYPFEKNKIYDLYFYHDDQDMVEASIGFKIPSFPPSGRAALGIYGVTYGPDLKALKLKRYFFPADPLLKHPELI